MVIHGNPRQGAHRLSLGSRGHHAYLLLRQAGEFPDIYEQIVRDVQVTQFPGDLHVGHHGAAIEKNLPAGTRRRLHDLLHAVDIAGKGGNDDTPPALGKDLVERFPDHLFRQGVPFPLHVGGIGHEGENAFLAIPSEGDQVGKLPVHRRLVDLEVSRMDHHPFGGSDCQAAAVHDGMGDPDELHLEAAGAHLLPRLHHVQGDFVVQLEFLELLPDEAEGQGSAVKGRVDVPEHVRQRADVVFMPVGEEDAEYPVRPVAKIRNIRDDEIDPQHVRFRKHEPAVHDDDVVAVLEDRHVEADFPEPTERNDVKRWLFLCRHSPLVVHYRLCRSLRMEERGAILASHFSIHAEPGCPMPRVE